MSAALLPRVRVIAVCDGALASDVEADVFTLENVRHEAVVASFPHVRSMDVYLMLSYQRADIFNGSITLIENATERSIRYQRFVAQFDGHREFASLVVPLEGCRFPRAGHYTLQIRLSTDRISEAMKGEHPIILASEEEST